MKNVFFKELDAAYTRLELKRDELFFALSTMTFELDTGWYNGHYHRTHAGGWQRESYPIPVIGVQGICDIEIHFRRVAVSAKLKRDAALAYAFEQLAQYEFEAYGVQDFLLDLYRPGLTLERMMENIRNSNEAEIGFSFIFPFDTDAGTILDFVKLLLREGFFY